MGGIATDSGRGGRRSVDSEINMIPMIDLLMVTVSFLLITAVWSSMARVNADAQVPGPPSNEHDEPPTPRLHVRALGASFQLEWKRGTEVISTREVSRPPAAHVATTTGARSGPAFVYPELATALGEEFRAHGDARAQHGKWLESAVLHTPDEMRYEELIAMMDAVTGVKKADGGVAFNTVLASN